MRRHWGGSLITGFARLDGYSVGVIGNDPMVIAGAKLANRNLWIAAAVLLAFVVVKLFAVDLSNTDTVERVVSFVAVGALLIGVGFFAPVPPRDRPAGARG